MDTITHGIVGALIGKAFFTDVAAQAATHKHPPATYGDSSTTTHTGDAAQGQGPPLQTSAEGAVSPARMTIWVATLGAIFPDSDSIFDAFDTTGMAVITEHRGLTHSVFLLPLWAIALALVTVWLARRRGWPRIPAGRLAVIFGVGIASHIVLDLLNSWGTMIWMPFERKRVVWDLVFVIDFTFSAIALAPQMAAWAYRQQEGSTARRMMAWMLFSLGAVGVERLGRMTGYAFSAWVIAVVSVAAAALFMVPQHGHLGFDVSRRAWCRAGVLALAGYAGLCVAAHRVALERVQGFADAKGLQVETLAAIPLPPSLTRWAGLVRTPEGVYEAQFSVLSAQPAFFRFVADAPPNRYIDAARQAPATQDFLWFARFPVVSYQQAGGLHVVEFRDERFATRNRRQRNSFGFRVTLDAEGRVLQAGWAD